MGDFLKIGHRGACGCQPENTILSFMTAKDLGADAVEFDVRQTKDGHLVVMHDATVNRTTNGRGRVRDLTLGEIKNLDAGKKEKVPTLDNIFSAFGNSLFYNAELKERGIAAQVIKSAKKHKVEENLILSSFTAIEGRCETSGWFELFSAKALEPKIKIGLLAKDRHWANTAVVLAQFYKSLPVFSFHFSRRATDGELIKKVRQSVGCNLFVWTCNEPREIEKFKKMGVDGIFSDYPDRL